MVSEMQQRTANADNLTFDWISDVGGYWEAKDGCFMMECVFIDARDRWEWGVYFGGLDGIEIADGTAADLNDADQQIEEFLDGHSRDVNDYLPEEFTS